MECRKDGEHYEPLYFHPGLILLECPAKNSVLGLAQPPLQRCQTFPLLFAHMGVRMGQGRQGSPSNLNFDIFLLNV